MASLNPERPFHLGPTSSQYNSECPITCPSGPPGYNGTNVSNLLFLLNMFKF